MPDPADGLAANDGGLAFVGTSAELFSVRCLGDGTYRVGMLEGEMD